MSKYVPSIPGTFVLLTSSIAVGSLFFMAICSNALSNRKDKPVDIQLITLTTIASLTSLLSIITCFYCCTKARKVGFFHKFEDKLTIVHTSSNSNYGSFIPNINSSPV